MKTGKIFATLLTAALLGPVGAASASTLYYDAETPYLSFDDSPFVTFANNPANSWFIEDFEDGVLDAIGVNADGGSVFFGSASVDSVDFDDGVFDGNGANGNSYKHAASEGQLLTFTFDEETLGALPTRAGLVWTDGHPEALVRFEAFDAANNSLGMIETTLGDAFTTGETEEDRFFGIAFNGGIKKITMFHEFGGLEIDHLQYGFGGAVIPLPPAAALGLAGLGFVAWRRRRQQV